MKVVHLTSVHSALDDRILYKECYTLARNGYEVVLVAPGAADGEIDGVKIRTVPQPRNRLERVFLTIWRVCRLALAEKASVYHLHDPELLCLVPLLRMRGKRVIYDAHEHLPRQILAKPWILRGLRPMIAASVDLAERSLALFCHAVIAVTPTVAARFHPARTFLVRNYPRLDEIGGNAVFGARKRDLPYAVYAGGLSENRGILEIVDAMGGLAADNPLRLKLAGAFSSDAYEERVRRSPGWRRVDFQGWLSRDQIREALAEARFGFVLLHPDPNYLFAYPVKMFEYMAAGVPVIASDFPLWREMVEDSGVGLVVNPLDTDAIANAIRWLCEHPGTAAQMGERGYEAATTKYNWTSEARTLCTLYAQFT